MPPRPGDVVGDPDLSDAAQRALTKGGGLIGGTATTKYMRTGGTNTGPNNQTGPGSLRRATGRLARSLLDKPNDRAASEGIFKITRTQGGASLEYGSEVPYAAAHEHGLDDTVQVSAHQRTQTHVFGRELNEPLTVQVSAHQRHMQMPERPYLGPALEDVIDDVVEIVERETLQELFTDASD